MSNEVENNEPKLDFLQRHAAKHGEAMTGTWGHIVGFAVLFFLIVLVGVLV